MVAIDEGADCLKALNDTLIMMNKMQDKLFLITVVEDIAYRYAMSATSAPILMDTQHQVETQSRRKLQRLGKRCLELGVS